jgi:sugar O-acyltransferase (sialic acid O-acetyltransferase NeuD family)
MKILILGASGHAKVIIDLIERSGQHEVVGLLGEDRPDDGTLCGYLVMGRIEDLPSICRAQDVQCLVAGIGDNWSRSETICRVGELRPGSRFLTASHPSAQIARDVEMGEGTVVMAGAVINSGAQIGRHCIINTGARVDHDCVLGDFVSIAPGATLGGNVRIGTGSAISLGVGVIHGMTIGEDTVIGAGAIVLEDVPAGVVAYGLPARVVRARARGERYL